jgi:hypothetical protein
MRVRVKSGFVLGPGKIARAGDEITIDEKDTVLLSAIHDLIEPIPPDPAGAQTSAVVTHRDPNVRNQTARPRRRRVPEGDQR